MTSVVAPTKLRLITYMSPSLPIEYFETISHYLESKLNIHTVLLYESRWEGPPLDRKDPFTTDEVDIAFVSSASFLRMIDDKNHFIKLLPVTSIHQHPKSEGKPGYFSDIVVNEDLRDKVKEFIDLRGCKWAYSKPGSLSGYLITLRNLKLLGENPSFFGNLLPSGSHINSIQMVLQKQADATAVDSNCLANFLVQHPEIKDEIFLLNSWGPLPPYPIVINKRLPESFQKKLTSALLTMHQDPVWGKHLSKFKVTKFATNDDFVYDTEKELIRNVKGLSSSTVYY